MQAELKIVSEKYDKVNTVLYLVSVGREIDSDL